MNYFHLPHFITDAFPKALDLMEPLAGSTYLDVVETVIERNRETLCISLMIPATLLSYFSPYPFAVFAISSLGLWLGSYSTLLPAKKDFIAKKIEPILAESKGQSKKALIIQSVKDTGGALSMRAHVEKMRHLAKTHEIERVVIQNKKDFMEKLPPNRFDIVWVRGHGYQTSIEMGDFFLKTNSAPKYFHTLASKIKENGKLILECCNAANTAGGKKSIAEHIASYSWDASIYAPSLKISGICGLDFDKWGYPQFYDGIVFKGKNITRIIEGPERTARPYFWERPLN